MAEYEAVIGLEVHCQLNTNSKLFCSCPVNAGLGPNEAVCEICTAMPGPLPSLNEQAVANAAKLGLAINAKVNLRSVFARKNYFYPDLPKAYQISQYDPPICEGGYLDIVVDGAAKRIRINRIHMEEDAGKTIHSAATNQSFVDLNRGAVPLMEIVSEPDLRSSEQAVAYLKALHNIVLYLGVSDGNMEEGNFRCDANVSIKPKGSEVLGTRTELKNLNSFRNVQRAIDYEIERHRDVLGDGKAIVQETRLYDAVKNTTLSMRSKEEAHDYRYCPDPDLLPVLVSEEQIAAWAKELPELPVQRKARFEADYGLSADDADLLTSDRGLADYFEAAAGSFKDYKRIANLMLGEFLRELNQAETGIAECKMQPECLASLARLISEGVISSKIGHDIFPQLFAQGQNPEDYVKAQGLVQISDSGAIEEAVDRVIAANPAEVEAFKGGKTKLISFFVGQVMRETKGKANPGLVNELLQKKLS